MALRPALLLMSSVLYAVLAGWPTSSLAYPELVSPSLPASYAYECADCHVDPIGTTACSSTSVHPRSPCLNSFGRAYLQGGWSTSLGATDTDGDGTRNEAELQTIGRSAGFPQGAEGICSALACASTPGVWTACSGNVRCNATYSASPASNYLFSFSCETGATPPPSSSDTNWSNNCLDVNECAGNPCDVGSCSELSLGSGWTSPGYTCSCPSGFEETGGSCVNVDECSLGTHTCEPTETCVDTQGSFTCEPAGPAVPGLGPISTGLVAGLAILTHALVIRARRRA